MTQIVRPRDAAELAVLMPYQLGFHPGPSVCLTLMRERRLGLLQRHDLVVEPDVARRVAAEAVAIALREGASSVLLMAFEDDEGGSRPLRAAVTSAGLAAGLAVPDHVVVRDGRCWVPGCDDGCCPPQVRVLPRPEEVPAVAEWAATLAGRPVLGNYVYADGGTNLRLSAASDALATRLTARRPDTVLAFMATPTDVFAVPPEAVAAAFRAVRPDWVFHLAGYANTGRSFKFFFTHRYIRG